MHAVAHETGIPSAIIHVGGGCCCCRQAMSDTGDFALLGQMDLIFKQVTTWRCCAWGPASTLVLTHTGPVCCASLQTMFSALLTIRMRSRAICRMLGLPERPLLRVRAAGRPTGTSSFPSQGSCSHSWRLLLQREEGHRVLLMALPPGLYKMGSSGRTPSIHGPWPSHLSSCCTCRDDP